MELAQLLITYSFYSRGNLLLIGRMQLHLIKRVVLINTYFYLSSVGDNVPIRSNSCIFIHKEQIMMMIILDKKQSTELKLRLIYYNVSD